MHLRIKDLNIRDINEIIVDCRHEWIQDLSRMNDTRVPRMVSNTIQEAKEILIDQEGDGQTNIR
jgi:uncharacterized protein (UPF0147 family)